MLSHCQRGRDARGLAPRAVALLAVVAAWLTVPTARASAQTSTSHATIDSLLAYAATTSPRIRAATLRIDAARARVKPAGLRPDPMVMVGVQNLPVFKPGFGDEMTMKMIGASQGIPLWGKLGLARSAAAAEVTVATEELRARTLEIRRDVLLPAYDLAYVDRALDVVERNRVALIDMIRAAEVRFGTGATGAAAPNMSAGQTAAPSGLADVLRARVDAAKLGEQAAMLREERRSILGAINALLSRPSETPIDALDIPSVLERAAVADSSAEIRFESAMLGSRASGSPLPSVDSLQRVARNSNAEIRSRAAMIAVQAIRTDLAARERRPDVEATVQYGQRNGYPDMLTAMISVPLVLHRRERQDQYVVAERSELAALEAERLEIVNRVNADIARLHAAAERSRTQLALYKTAVIPQSRLGVDAALVAFTSGGGALRTVLDAQTAVFNAEIAFHRVLADFARAIAELENVVGAEVIHD